MSAPATPTNLQITNVQDTSLRATWDAPITGYYGGFVIEYDPSNGQLPELVEVPKDQKAITFPGLTPNTLYTVSVRSYMGYNGNKRISAKVEESQLTGQWFSSPNGCISDPTWAHSNTSWAQMGTFKDILGTFQNHSVLFHNK